MENVLVLGRLEVVVVIVVISRSNSFIRFTRDRRRDGDNLLTTVLDYLREAGLIVNDNIKTSTFPILLPIVIDKAEQGRRGEGVSAAYWSEPQK